MKVELIMPVLAEVFSQAGINNAQDVDFGVAQEVAITCREQPLPLSLVLTHSARCPPLKNHTLKWTPPWALYESMLKIRMGHADSALIYGFGKSSPGELPIVIVAAARPLYTSPPLWVDTIALAAMQARMLLDQGKNT